MNHPEFAEYWARKLGANIENLEKLSGGINNLVYLCRGKQFNWVIKGYPLPKPGQQDRMKADVDFLRYSAHVAKGFTPILLEVDVHRRCAVMEHIQGVTYPEGYAPCQNELEAAFSFIHRLNDDIELAREMVQMNAAEGFLSLKQHMANVLARVSEMETEHLPHQHQAQAKRILGELYELAELVNLRLELKFSSGILEDALDRDECCVSPSDFGFHNAIRMEGGVKFIDFEFAGWDDPAKLCIDFVLQQRNPIRLQSIDIASRLFPGREIPMKRRIDALTEILRLKWLCIIMGILNPGKLFDLINTQHDLTCESVVATQIKRYDKYCKNTLPFLIM